jgi:hypothetical protein
MSSFLLNPNLSNEECEKLLKLKAEQDRELFDCLQKNLAELDTVEKKAMYARLVLPVVVSFMFM